MENRGDADAGARLSKLYHQYNSCRNRHCPKCQSAAAKDWLAAREADSYVYSRITFCDHDWSKKIVVARLTVAASASK
jgi:hypothetical protein